MLMSRWRDEHHELKTFIHCFVEREVFLLDLVSYKGPRSMVTVDMSVDSRSTDGRYLGRASVATRSTLGR